MPPCRVELTDEALEDLEGLRRSGNHLKFLKKLGQIERDDQTGHPVGSDLGGFRKVTVGNRDWRILYRTHDGVATVVAIGKREDKEVYEDARERLSRLEGNPAAKQLSAILLSVIEDLADRGKK